MPRPKVIDRDAILEAGLGLADRGGLASVTMQAVASELGVTPMALYRHVRNKAELLDGLVERLLDEVQPPRVMDGWEALAAMANVLRRVARRHPAVFPLLLHRPATTSRSRMVRDRVYTALSAAGVARRDLVIAERLVSTLAIGLAISEVAGRFPDRCDATFRALPGFVRGGLAALRR